MLINSRNVCKDYYFKNNFFFQIIKEQQTPDTKSEINILAPTFVFWRAFSPYPLDKVACRVELERKNEIRHASNSSCLPAKKLWLPVFRELHFDWLIAISVRFFKNLNLAERKMAEFNKLLIASVPKCNDDVNNVIPGIICTWFC